MKANFFYIGLFMQLFGMASVSLCLYSGISKGDYGQLELIQFIGGSTIFYFGNYLKRK